MSADITRFWDERAAEDAFYFVDTRLAYRHPDLERFWAGGPRDLDALLTVLGTSVGPSDHVLEISCGVGRLTRVLADRAASVTALDVSGVMLELARHHNPRLENVEWMLGDGSTLAGVESESVDACVSYVVFQHIPDPGITLNYVREIGRVLRPGGWAAFHISNDPRVHRRRPIRTRAAIRTRASHVIRALLGFAPRGQQDARWRGSQVELEDLRRASADGGMEIVRLVGERTQFCLVLTRRLERRPPVSAS